MKPLLKPKMTRLIEWSQDHLQAPPGLGGRFLKFSPNLGLRIVQGCLAVVDFDPASRTDPTDEGL
jgi:hypothetical protein